jgi:hypothetical protein
VVRGAGVSRGGGIHRHDLDPESLEQGIEDDRSAGTLPREEHGRGLDGGRGGEPARRGAGDGMDQPIRRGLGEEDGEDGRGINDHG